MDTNNNIQELEQMRSQLNILKEKLDRQEIINERMLRASMKSKMSWIDKYRWISLFIVPFVALCFLPMTIEMNVWGLYGFTILMVAASVIADWFINRMPEHTFLESSMLELSDKLLRMKRYRKIQLFIGMCLIVVWLGWLLYEVYTKGYAAQTDPGMQKYYIGFMIAIGIGAVIGLAIGLYVFFKMQRTNDRILQEIEKMKEE